MGLRTISQHLPGEPDYALANGRMFQMVRAALERTGVRLMDIELARVADGVDVMSYEKEFALGAELGAKYAIASVWSADRDFSRVQFEKMCDLADKYGMKDVYKRQRRGCQLRCHQGRCERVGDVPGL